jgi:hypothetical protein
MRRHFEAACADTPPAQALHVSRELALLELDMAATDEDSLIRDGLHEFLDRFQQRLIKIDQLMAEHIFRLLPATVR